MWRRWPSSLSVYYFSKTRHAAEIGDISATSLLFPRDAEDCCDYDGNVSELLQMRGAAVELPTAAGWVGPADGVSLLVCAGECGWVVGEAGGGRALVSLA